jgi:hypothetical protein
MVDRKSIGLADLIQEVRRELLQVESVQGESTQDASQPATPLLLVDDVTLELKVTVSGKVNGGINIQVVQIGGGAELDQTHTITVKLRPIVSDAERIEQLRKNNQWDSVVHAAMQATVKGAEGPLINE